MNVEQLPCGEQTKASVWNGDIQEPWFNVASACRFVFNRQFLWTALHCAAFSFYASKSFNFHFFIFCS
ncbi:hypothetical protein Csa_002225 [Cucumis sativus]|uniref:Uncharacterized protein n=1 Tax=Cucumis sativus TaxID=3659 RepID=A0A0A0LAS2_CUCSA|nr:hypothetical protein Csa_002225 [Cucumis sativus]